MPDDPHGNFLETLDDSRAVEVYDPVRGLQKIAVAEAAAKIYARARDAEQLYAAIEAKLIEQRKFVVWYDAQPKDPGGRPPETGNGTVTGFVSLPAVFGIGPEDANGIKAALMMISRWRRALKEVAAFALALDEARHRAVRICKQQKMGTIRGTEGTGEFELYTPAPYVEAARTAMGGIDLDPASNPIAQQTIKAARFFTTETNGLAQQWRGRVWLNPPYHRELLPAFVTKLIEEVDAARVTAAIMLTNNCTDTDWFLEAQVHAQAVCFTHGRIRFLQRGGAEVAPTQGQAFFYFGNDVGGFAEAFREIGYGFTASWAYAGE